MSDSALGTAWEEDSLDKRARTELWGESVPGRLEVSLLSRERRPGLGTWVSLCECAGFSLCEDLGFPAKSRER